MPQTPPDTLPADFSFDAPDTLPADFGFDIGQPPTGKRNYQPPNMSGMDPLTSYGAATKYGVKTAAQDIYSVGKGAMQAFAPPQGTTEQMLTALGPLALPIKRAIQGSKDLPSQIMQVPDAIHDINQSADPTSAYAGMLQHDLGQGAGTALAAAATEGAVKGLGGIPSKLTAKAAFSRIQAKAGALAVDGAPAGNVALNIQDLADAGAQRPQVIGKYLKRMSDPDKGPLTYTEARRFYGNASRLSANEYMRLTSEMQGQVVEFTKALGKSIQETADTVGEGQNLANAIGDYRKATLFGKRVAGVKSGMQKAAITGALGAAGGAGATAAYKILSSK